MALALGLAVALTLPAVADDSADEAKVIAVKATSAGAAMFDARDAKGLALTYTEDARVEIFNRESTGAMKVEIKTGRAEIEGYYESLFKNSGAVHAKNTIEHARKIDADLIAFSGVFEPNSESAEPLKLPFMQVRIRQGDHWKILSLQLFVVPQK
jgi:hypothetical protein